MLARLSAAVAIFLLGIPTFLGVVHGHPHGQKCPPFNNGTFFIDQYQLYPENGDWDTKNCLLYFGSLFNSTVVIYDPYKAQTVDILTFPGITHNPLLHLGGVGVDPFTGLVSIVVDAAAPFLTNGQDISGDNFIMKWDPRARKVLWRHNITAVSQGLYGGFQDVETDRRGNTYVVGTFPGTIMRVDPRGKAVTPWYLPGTGPPYNSTTSTRYGSLAVTGDIMLVNDAEAGEIYRLDTRAEKGNPVLVPRTPAGSRRMNSDSIYLPPKYGGKVLLVSEDPVGVNVLRSRDGRWETAEYLGFVSNDVPEGGQAGGMVPAATQIGDSLFMIEEFFADPFVPGGVAGNRSLFPMVDITQQVAALLGE